MELPKITIVTPVFNGAEYLEETIKSVLSQGYPNLEYIIVDGGSTDGTVDIIKKYESALAFWVSEPDRGMYDAIRKGFEHSTGDVLGWLNSDDMYHPGALSVVGEVFSKFTDVQWIEGMHSLRDAKGRTYSVDTDAGPSNKFDLLLDCGGWIQQESCFWRRGLYEKVGGINPDIRLAGDFDLWLRFFGQTDLYFVEALLGGFRLWSDKQLSAGGKYEMEKRQVIESYTLSPEDKKTLSRYSLVRKLGCYRLVLKFKKTQFKNDIVLRYDSSLREFKPVNLF